MTCNLINAHLSKMKNEYKILKINRKFSPHEVCSDMQYFQLLIIDCEYCHKYLCVMAALHNTLLTYLVCMPMVIEGASTLSTCELLSPSEWLLFTLVISSPLSDSWLANDLSNACLMLSSSIT